MNQQQKIKKGISQVSMPDSDNYTSNSQSHKEQQQLFGQDSARSDDNEELYDGAVRHRTYTQKFSFYNSRPTELNKGKIDQMDTTDIETKVVASTPNPKDKKKSLKNEKSLLVRQTRGDKKSPTHSSKQLKKSFKSFFTKKEKENLSGESPPMSQKTKYDFSKKNSYGMSQIDSAPINLPKDSGIKECRGYNEIPKVLIEQSQVLKDNQKILHKFLQANDKKRKEQKKELETEQVKRQMTLKTMNSIKSNNDSSNQSQIEESPSKTFLPNWMAKLRNSKPKQQQQSQSIGEQKLLVERRVSTMGTVEQDLVSNEMNMESEGFSSSSNSEDDMDGQLDQQMMNQIEIDNSCLVLRPESPIRVAWDIALFFCIIYQAIVLPMRISFEMAFNEPIFYFEVIVDCMFMFDIIMNFNTGYYYQGNRLVMTRKHIATEYMCPWFFLDVLSSAPYTWILAAAEGISIKAIESDDNSQLLNEDGSPKEINSTVASAPQLLRLLKIAKMLKMLKLLRVMKIKKLMGKFDEYIVTDGMNLMVTFFQLTIGILVICHYIACTFFYFGLDEHRTDPNVNGWLKDANLLEKNFTTQYITTMYWAFTTMSAVGYGDIHPITRNEMYLGLQIMLVSSGIFAYTINRISSSVQSFNVSITQFRERMLYINQFTKKKKMPYELQRKIRRFLDYEFEKLKDNKLDEKVVSKILNQDLSNQITIYLRGRTISNIVFIKVFGVEFISQLTNFFKNATYAQEEFIFHEKDKSQSIIYIHSGKCAMIEKHSHTFVKEIGPDNYFGEIGAITGNLRCLTVKCRDFTETFTVRADDFFRTCENYREAISAIERIKKELLSEVYTSLQIKCYICGLQDHLSLKCPKYHVKSGNLIQLLNKSEEKTKFVKFLHGSVKKSIQLGNSIRNINSEKIKKKSKNSLKNERIKNDDGILAPKYRLKRPPHFIYPNETSENKQHCSAEDSDDYDLKQKYIGIYVQETKHGELDGRIISQILEEPKIYDQIIVKQKKKVTSALENNFLVTLKRRKIANTLDQNILRHMRQKITTKSNDDQLSDQTQKLKELQNRQNFSQTLTLPGILKSQQWLSQNNTPRQSIRSLSNHNYSQHESQEIQDKQSDTQMEFDPTPEPQIEIKKQKKSDRNGMKKSRNNQAEAKKINTTVSDKLDIVKEDENENKANLSPQITKTKTQVSKISSSQVNFSKMDKEDQLEKMTSIKQILKQNTFGQIQVNKQVAPVLEENTSSGNKNPFNKIQINDVLEDFNVIQNPIDFSKIQKHNTEVKNDDLINLFTEEQQQQNLLKSSLEQSSAEEIQIIHMKKPYEESENQNSKWCENVIITPMYQTASKDDLAEEKQQEYNMRSSLEQLSQGTYATQKNQLPQSNTLNVQIPKKNMFNINSSGSGLQHMNFTPKLGNFPQYNLDFTKNETDQDTHELNEQQPPFQSPQLRDNARNSQGIQSKNSFGAIEQRNSSGIKVSKKDVQPPLFHNQMANVNYSHEYLQSITTSKNMDVRDQYLDDVLLRNQNEHDSQLFQTVNQHFSRQQSEVSKIPSNVLDTEKLGSKDQIIVYEGVEEHNEQRNYEDQEKILFLKSPKKSVIKSAIRKKLPAPLPSSSTEQLNLPKSDSNPTPNLNQDNDEPNNEELEEFNEISPARHSTNDERNQLQSDRQNVREDSQSNMKSTQENFHLQRFLT